MNTVIPETWIIQEEIRRENEKRRRESEGKTIPISLPEHSEPDRSRKGTSESNAPKQDTVIIIDL